MEGISDPDISIIVIYALTAVLLFALFSSTLAAIFAIRKSPEIASKSLKEFFSDGNAVKILTVFAVLVAATYLSLAGQLSESMIALLSSIAGYVLGSLKKDKAEVAKS